MARVPLIHVGVMSGAVPVYGAGGTPALPGGLHSTGTHSQERFGVGAG